MNDKHKINQDCPSCCHKHLTAALAALSLANILHAERARPEDPGELLSASQSARLLNVLLWGSQVARQEAYHGYHGNLALSQGYLALAENLAETFEEATAIRTDRLEAGPEILPWHPEPSTFPLWELALAHLIEACRELSPGVFFTLVGAPEDGQGWWHVDTSSPSPEYWSIIFYPHQLEEVLPHWILKLTREYELEHTGFAPQETLEHEPKHIDTRT